MGKSVTKEKSIYATLKEITGTDMNADIENNDKLEDNIDDKVD